MYFGDTRLDWQFGVVLLRHDHRICFSTTSVSVGPSDRCILGHMEWRVALFHDNLAQMGGAERVTEALYETLIPADLYSTLAVRERLSRGLRAAPLRVTWMQWLPFKAKLFRHYFLFYPIAVELVDLRAYDLIVTSCFGFAKGVRKRKGAVHVCYCHTPMRWVWRRSDYFANEGVGYMKGKFLDWSLGALRQWETRAAARPDFYIANSQVVAERLKTSFGIESTVIPPPIDTRRFEASDMVEDYFLVLARLVPYKRLDLAVRAASELGLPLKVVGSGPDLGRLQSMAGPSVDFLGRQSDEAVNRLVSRCQALLFPGEEDFGMVPLEVNAAGRPVIAFFGGGAIETVVEGLNGIFFRENTVASLKEALQRFQTLIWDTKAIQAHARTYDTVNFKRKIRDFLNRATQGKFPTVLSAEIDSPGPGVSASSIGHGPGQ